VTKKEKEKGKENRRKRRKRREFPNLCRQKKAQLYLRQQ
jgi:hypothetical protein